MYTNIIGTQQIVITAAFLGVMILILIVLRKKSTVIRASMKAGKRIVVIEDSAVSPTERLRLVKIDGSEFVMVSAKGHAPSLIHLTNDHAKSKLRKNSKMMMWTMVVRYMQRWKRHNILHPNCLQLRRSHLTTAIRN